MLAVEFQTIIRNGIIALPDNYSNWQNKTVKVILLTTDKPITTTTTKRQPGKAKDLIKLMDNFDAPLQDFCEYML